MRRRAHCGRSPTSLGIGDPSLGWIALWLCYVINPARRFTTNNRSVAPSGFHYKLTAAHRMADRRYRKPGISSHGRTARPPSTWISATAWPRAPVTTWLSAPACSPWTQAFSPRFRHPGRRSPRRSSHPAVLRAPAAARHDPAPRLGRAARPEVSRLAQDQHLRRLIRPRRYALLVNGDIANKR